MILLNTFALHAGLSSSGILLAFYAESCWFQMHIILCTIDLFIALLASSHNGVYLNCPFIDILLSTSHFSQFMCVAKIVMHVMIGDILKRVTKSDNFKQLQNLVLFCSFF